MAFQYTWLSEITAKEKLLIRQLFIASIQDEGMLGFEESEEEQIDVFIDKLATKVISNISQVLLIMDESCEKPVGIVVFTQTEHKTSKHIAELSKVIIDPYYRGSGVLKNGIRELCIRGVKLGVTRFIFDVREGTASAKLWSALGFETYGRLSDYSHYRDQVFSGLFMTASIKDLLAKYQKN
jgi:L-amino acid N-acyltransferase YncA